MDNGETPIPGKRDCLIVFLGVILAAGLVSALFAESARDRFYDLEISPDGRTLVRRNDSGLRIFDIETQTLLGSLGQTGPFAYSRDGKSIAYADGPKTIQVRDLPGLSLRCTLKGHTAHPGALAFTAGGRELVSGDVDGQIAIWNLTTGQIRSSFKAHRLSVHAIAVSPDGRLLVSGGNDWPDRRHLIKIWDAQTQFLQIELECEGYSAVDQLTFSPDGHWLLAAVTHGWDGYLDTQLWNLDNHRVVHTWRHQSQMIFSPDGKSLVGNSYDWEHRIKVFDPVSGQERLGLDGPSTFYWKFAWTETDLLSAASKEGKVIRWEMAQGRQVESTTGVTWNPVPPHWWWLMSAAAVWTVLWVLCPRTAREDLARSMVTLHGKSLIGFTAAFAGANLIAVHWVQSSDISADPTLMWLIVLLLFQLAVGGFVAFGIMFAGARRARGSDCIFSLLAMGSLVAVTFYLLAGRMIFEAIASC